MGGRRTVGVRELRQNLSVYLRRVKQGEALEVTERGQPVAMLGPLPGRASTVDRLRAEGKLIPGRGSLSDLGPPASVEGNGTISDALEAEREDIV